MKRVLILGGTGLISSAIVDRLVYRGDEVILFNRGISRRTPSVSVRTITGNRRDAEELAVAVTAAGPLDAVIDMVGFSVEDTHALVQAAAGRVRQVVFCSTVDVYAKPLGPSRFPVDEDEPQQGLNAYGRGKVECERILRKAESDRAFALTVMRPAHTYDDRGTLIHAPGGGTAILDRLRRGLTVIIHGDGTSLWCQTHANDVAAAFAAATGNPESYGRSYNVTSDEWVSWNTIYQVVCRVNHWPDPTIEHVPSSILAKLLPEQGKLFPENFQFSNVFCSSRAKQDLDFNAKITLAEGAARVVCWLKSNDGIAEAESQPWYDLALKRWKSGLQAIDSL